jgi:hypothetical protein
VLRVEYGTFQLGFIKGSESGWERVLNYFWFVSAESFYLLFPIIFFAIIIYLYLNMFVYEDVAENIFNKKNFDGINGRSNNNKINDEKVIKNSNKKNKNDKKNNNKINDTNCSKISIEKKINKLAPIIIKKKKNFENILFLFFSWVFYIIIWHFVFSNIPLNAKMPFNVHARFWFFFIFLFIFIF